MKRNLLAPLTCLLTLSFGLSGCSTLEQMRTKELPTESTPEAPQANYFVEMHPNFGKPKLYRGEITKPTTVQEALEISGALSEFKSCTVDLYRPLPDGTPLKLPVEFKKGKRVKYEQDYAIHPNDRIIVRSKSNSPLDKFVDQVLGDL